MRRHGAVYVVAPSRLAVGIFGLLYLKLRHTKLRDPYTMSSLL